MKLSETMLLQPEEIHMAQENRVEQIPFSDATLQKLQKPLASPVITPEDHDLLKSLKQESVENAQLSWLPDASSLLSGFDTDSVVRKHGEQISAVDDVHNQSAERPEQRLPESLSSDDVVYETTNRGNEIGRLQGQIVQFRYRGASAPFQIAYGLNNQIRSITCPNGDCYERVAPDPTSPWQAERRGTGWTMYNPRTRERLRSPADLGTVTVDENGLHANGTNADYLNLPRR